MTLTITDLFCGAGGSSTGAVAAGVSVRVASNHWDLAIETHNTNHQDADHICADISQINPRYFPSTDLAWMSPECTNHSRAKGRKLDTLQTALWGESLPDEAAERSRATMWDVIRFTEVHRYKGVIVENVVEIADWPPYRSWLLAMDSLGYRAQVVSLNSMHAQAHGLPAPQSRDRVYVVFTLKINPAPDLDAIQRPLAYCPGCDRIVSAMQAWKRPDRDRMRPGRYRSQYVYRCPNAGCRNAVVEPAWLPASTIIDWTLPGQRIGDRKKPLAEKTRRRIAAGIARYWQPLHLEAAGNTYDAADPKHKRHGDPNSYYRAWPVDEPLRTLHTIESKALAVPVEGRDGKQAAPLENALRTQTTRNETALAFLAHLKGTSDAQIRSAHSPVSDPMHTVAASGNHHALVMSNNHSNRARPADEAAPTMTTATGGGHALLTSYYGGNNSGGPEMSTPVTEPVRTITTAGHQSLLTPPTDSGKGSHNGPRCGDPTRAQVFAGIWCACEAEPAALLTPAGGTWNDAAYPATSAMRTVTTRETTALVTAADIAAAEVYVDDVLFRMLEPAECKRAMAFPAEYVMLGNRREQVRLAGNAVTPPAARDLIIAVAATLGNAA